MKITPLICVIYDSIANATFQGTVLQPLLRKLTARHAQEVIIISFEKKRFTEEEMAKLVPMHTGLRLITLPKPTFWTRGSLKKAAQLMQPILNRFSTYHMIARGPIAGYICMQATHPSSCLSLIIQAHGLLAAEYAYTQKLHGSTAKAPWYALRTKQYKDLEYVTYNRQYTKPHISIEAISDAMKAHLVETYQADPYRVTLAKNEVLNQPSPEELATWRNELRTKLGIAPDAYVYCYNELENTGQTPQEIISFFTSRHAQEPKSFLLMLTKRAEELTTMLAQAHLDATCCCVLHINQKELYHYLAACDAGIVFRKAHTINWVSRPTEILEYQAARLAINHNSTIAYLAQPKKIETPQSVGE